MCIGNPDCSPVDANPYADTVNAIEDSARMLAERFHLKGLEWVRVRKAGSRVFVMVSFFTFIEYHFIDYTSDTLIVVREAEKRQLIQEVKKEFDLDLKQHLVGVGVRFHF
jgi:hypothetical protein